MPALKLEYLSEHLRATRNKLAEFRHGGVVLTSDQVEAFVGRFDQFLEMARALECEVSRREWNDRAARDPKLHDGAVPIGGNVVAFPGRSPDHHPGGAA